MPDSCGKSRSGGRPAEDAPHCDDFFLPAAPTADGLVSVIIPTFNRAALIGQTLESVLRQTYRPLEVIIVDDGSTDETTTVVRDWAANCELQSERIAVNLLIQANAGPSAARNRGFSHSHGEFIQFLDSDDLIHPEKVTTQVARLREGNWPFCVCNYRMFVDVPDNTAATVDFFSRSHRIEDFPAVYPMDTPAPLYRRSALEVAGPWDERLRAGEDFEFNFRVAARNELGTWLNQVLLYVRRHQGPERIQGTAFRNRFGSMYRGLVSIEIEAMERGLCNPRLLHNLAVRALAYYRYLMAEEARSEAMVFRQYARARLGILARCAYGVRYGIHRPLCKRIRRAFTVCLAGSRV